MMRTVEDAVHEMIRPIDPIRSGMSQFTIDWMESLQMTCNRETEVLEPESINGAFHYDVENICDVLKFGKDRDFFTMVEQYASLWIKSNPVKKQSRGRSVA